MASKKRIFLPIIILLLAVLIAIILAASRTAPERGGPERLPVLVNYETVAVADQQFSVASQGAVRPKYDTRLVAEVSGQVVHVSDRFVAGGYFEAGEVLVRIDPSDYEAAKEEAQANLKRAEAAVAEERARGRVAEAEWRSITEGEIPSLGLREPQLASELASLQSAQAQLAQAERNLERTYIRAPFAGVLQSRNVNLGQYVATNTEIGNLLATDVAEIRLPLTETDMAFLDVPTGLQPDAAGPEVTIAAEIAGQRYQWQGSLVRTEGVVESTSQVIYGVVEVRDPYNRKGPTHERVLPFGRFVEADVKGITMPNLIELPRTAVSSAGFVWVITDDEERVLERREVQIERRDRQSVYVSAGLAEGEKVLTTQLDNPITGQRVRITSDVEEAGDEAKNTDEVVTEGGAL
jgi:RND family efflux transporter MFP subunit